jgi:hypothetical protein
MKTMAGPAGNMFAQTVANNENSPLPQITVKDKWISMKTLVTVFTRSESRT